MEIEKQFSFEQVAHGIGRGEVVRIPHPLEGLTHPMTRSNDRGGYVSLELLTKQQVMQIYEARQRRIDSEVV